MIADGGVRLSTALAGGTWPVGARRTIAWKGAGPVDLLLSVNGGASYQDLATGLSGGATTGGQVSLTVPHTPSRFCKIKVRRTTPFSVSESESLFTIETSVSLLSLLAARIPDRAGAAVVSWNTDPGPADLDGYRLEKTDAAGPWRTVAALTRETAFTDEDAGAATRYRLFAVNGLGEELMLGETALVPLRPLSVWPSPYRGGALTVAYATASGWGGAEAPTVVSILEARGRLVRTLQRGTFRAGIRTVAWDGRDARGREVAAGIYFVTSRSAGAEAALKFAVLR
jgi:hypothetical protein